MNYQTLDVRFDGTVCFIRFARPETGNTINDLLIAEFLHVLNVCEESVTAVVLEGSDKVFCMGVDFQDLKDRFAKDNDFNAQPEQLYAIWEKLASGPYVSICNVKGRTNAGGIGFVAACDFVFADPDAEFSLSELVFGLLPACVMPFLARRVGFQKANYFTLSTLPVRAEEAFRWGLVDVCTAQGELAVRKQLSRLRRLSKQAIVRQKRFSMTLEKTMAEARAHSLAANHEVFSDPQNLASIRRYVETGLFPWEN